MAEAHMESRVIKLEQQVDGLSTAVSAMSGRVDKMSDSLSRLTTAIETNKPQSFTSILTTAVVTASLVSMIVGAIFFLVDTRVGYATTRSNQFVSEMTDSGKLYVELSRFNMRLERVEGAIQWKPTLVSTEIADSRKR